MSTATDFWSQRKARVRAEAEAELATAEAVELEVQLQVLEDKTDEEILTELELPDPDTLNQGDDFSAFMAKAVPERIKRRALRKLWLSNPALANLDGLVDYGEDFTDSAMVVENLQTAYQVGKGMLKHVIEISKPDDDLDDGEDTAGADAALAQGPEDHILELSETGHDPDVGIEDDANFALNDAGQDMPYEDYEEAVMRPVRRMRFSVSNNHTEHVGMKAEG